MSMVNADSVQLFAMLKKMQDSISSIETTKKSVKMKYEQLDGKIKNTTSWAWL